MTGYTDSNNIVGAPAAEACVNYTFPNGNRGYLGTSDEYKAMADVWQRVKSMATLIDGDLSALGQWCWSSDWSGTLSYRVSVTTNYSDYRDALYDVIPFTSITKFVINCNYNIPLNVTYTQYDDSEIRTSVFYPGNLQISPKKNSTITVSIPDDYDYLEFPITTQTIQYTGQAVELTFISPIEQGIYIQHTNGTLYTTTEWTDGGYSNDAANGVAVIDSSCAFTIAKKDVSAFKWGGYDRTIVNVVIESAPTALLDFDGKGNTTKIIEQLTGYTDSRSVTGAPAAEACVNYTFPNGSKGYLPSIGEWNVVYNNRTAIVQAMSLIGGSAIASERYWASTQYSSQSSWYLRWSKGTKAGANRDTVYYVRAFSSL